MKTITTILAAAFLATVAIPASATNAPLSAILGTPEYSNAAGNNKHRHKSHAYENFDYKKGRHANKSSINWAMGRPECRAA